MQETGAPTASPAATTPTGGDAGADGGATAGSLASGAGWTEHLSPDGRRYYYHKARGISSWEKPNELKTRAELSAAAAADSNWKEYTAASGARASQRAGLCAGRPQQNSGRASSGQERAASLHCLSVKDPVPTLRRTPPLMRPDPAPLPVHPPLAPSGKKYYFNTATR
eukprot:scaffold32120_cov62-Isochrysis_galbana.AAC.1